MFFCIFLHVGNTFFIFLRRILQVLNICATTKIEKTNSAVVRADLYNMCVELKVWFVCVK